MAKAKKVKVVKKAVKKVKKVYNAKAKIDELEGRILLLEDLGAKVRKQFGIV